MRIRSVPENNYHAIYTDAGKTFRFAINEKEPVTELAYPEFYDIGINSKCNGGCPYCYVDAKKSGVNFDNIEEKIYKFLSSTPKDQLPFQVAVGASGEPTMHPDFENFIKTIRAFDVAPSFTTNGMWSYTWDAEKCEEHLEFVKKYCGGVAVTAHPHLYKHWQRAVDMYADADIRTSIHFIISDADSIDDFWGQFCYWKPKVEYFVLLPYSETGRAKPKEIDWEYFKAQFNPHAKIAFGAYFYSFLQRGEIDANVSLYEPELFSKYLSLEGDGKLYTSSFAKKPYKENFL